MARSRAAALALCTTVAIVSAQGRERPGQERLPGPARAALSRPHIVLPTIRTSAHSGHVFVDVIKRDGTVWERRLTADRPLRFEPAEEIKPASGARAFGESMVALANGGFVTRQPVPQLAPADGWIRADRFGPASELGVAGQAPVRMIFPDRYLFSGGTLIQRDAPLGERIDTGRASGFFAAGNVADFGLSRRVLTALFADGSIVAIQRAQDSQPRCVITRSAASMSIGDAHAAAVTKDGRVQMWGELGMGQLGRPGHSSPEPLMVNGLTGITQVAISRSLLVLALALDDKGQVWTWGATGPREYVPPRRIAGLSGVIHIEYDFVGLALKADGTVWAFKPTTDETPVQVFDSARPSETVALDTLAASPCWRGVSKTPPVVFPAQPGAPPRAEPTPRADDPPAGTVKPPPSSRTSSTTALPQPYVIIRRYTCESAGGRSAGDVTVTTKSALSCADAENEHARLRDSKGGDFCSAAVPGTQTAGNPISLREDPCVPASPR